MESLIVQEKIVCIRLSGRSPTKWSEQLKKITSKYLKAPAGKSGKICKGDSSGYKFPWWRLKWWRIQPLINSFFIQYCLVLWVELSLFFFSSFFTILFFFFFTILLHRILYLAFLSVCVKNVIFIFLIWYSYILFLIP